MYKTSIIISLLPGELEYLKDCLQSIFANTKDEEYELIIIENGGGEEERTWLSHQQKLKVLFFDNYLNLYQIWTQGLEVSTGDSILFMHNDIVVCKNWLSSMLNILYEKDNIGAVGPITNHADNDQQNNEQFSSMEDLMIYAENINKIKLVEPRSILNGICILFKTEVLKKNEILKSDLDGSALVTDASLRLSGLGFELVLCRHVFLQHYGFNEHFLNRKQRLLFEKYWGFDIRETNIEINSIKKIEKEKNESFKVLLVGSYFNATALKLRYLFNHVEITNSPDFDLLQKKYFDYIIVNSSKDISKLKGSVIELLNDDGQLIMEFKNAKYYGIVKNILLDEGNLNSHKLWEISDIATIFDELGFQELDFDYNFGEKDKNDELFLQNINDLTEKLPEEFEIESFLTIARKQIKDVNIAENLKDFILNKSSESGYKILKHSPNKIVGLIESINIPKIEFLNQIGNLAFESRKSDVALIYFNEALKMNEYDSITLINIAEVLISNNQEQDALKHLLKIKENCEKKETLINEIKIELSKKFIVTNQLKFLIRRIENDVEQEEAISQVVLLLKENQVSSQNIIDVVKFHIIYKVRTLNYIATKFFEFQLYEEVLPMLEQAYLIDNQDYNTLFNLGSFLTAVSANREALNFLLQIKEANSEVFILINELKEKLNNE